MTRSYDLLQDQKFIKIKGKEQISLSETQDTVVSPWKDDVLFNGTDGMQFQPDLSKDDIISTFVKDL